MAKTGTKRRVGKAKGSAKRGTAAKRAKPAARKRVAAKASAKKRTGAGKRRKSVKAPSSPSTAEKALGAVQDALDTAKDKVRGLFNP